MGGGHSKSESRGDGSGNGRYAHSASFQQPAAPQWGPPGAGGYPYGAGQDAQGDRKSVV